MNNSKRCARCGAIKCASEYYANDTYRCKNCHKEVSLEYRHTIDGFLTVSYAAKKSSSKKRGHNPPSFSKKQFFDFAKNSRVFMKLWHSYVNSGFDRRLAPSFDRLDDSMGYSIENFNSWMTWAENNKKGNSDIRSCKLKHGNKPQRSVVQMDVDSNEINTFLSLHEAGRQTGSDYRNIWAVCNNKMEMSNGYKWKYKE